MTNGFSLRSQHEVVILAPEFLTSDGWIATIFGTDSLGFPPHKFWAVLDRSSPKGIQHILKFFWLFLFHERLKQLKLPSALASTYASRKRTNCHTVVITTRMLYYKLFTPPT